MHSHLHVVCCLLLSMSLAGTSWALETKAAAPEDQFLRLVGDGIKKIQELCPPYFSKSSHERMFLAALNGLLREIDPSGTSCVLKKEAVTAEARFTPQIRLRLLEGVPTVASVIVHSEASRHDIRQGDLVVKVDAKLVLGKGIEQISAMMEGALNTSVKMAFFRPTTNLFHEETLKRELIEPAVYARKIAGKLGYVQMNIIDDKSVQDFESKLQLLTREKLSGLILDLRNTVGGRIEHAAKVADSFLPDKERVVGRVQDLQGTRSIQASTKTTYVRLPVVVLQNMGTQGAAEVVAAALQENHRAVLMGESTFGSGTSEMSHSLSPDYIIRMATTYVFTPTGKEIMGRGIAADIQERIDSIPQDKFKPFREEFDQFCKGIIVTTTTPAKPKKGSEPASTPSTSTSTPTTSTVDSGEEDEDDEQAKSTPAKSDRPQDQLLDEYPLVRRYDTTLLRAANLLISTNIFYEQFLQN